MVGQDGPVTALESTAEFAFQDLVRRFDLELSWKEELESKAVQLLGFVGIFVAILLSVTSLGPNERADVMLVLALPMSLQVAAAILLFVVIFGYPVMVGPAIIDVFQTRQWTSRKAKLGIMTAYGTSILRNRILLSRSVFCFQSSVLLAAASLLQVVPALIATAWDPTRESFVWFWNWILWVPGLVVAIAGILCLYHDYVTLHRRQTQELSTWEFQIDVTEGPKHG